MVSYSDVKEAYVRIKDKVNKTPVMTSRTLTDLVNADIFLKP